MTTARISHYVLLGIAAVLTGCGSSGDFDGGKAKAILETKPVNLDGEQVSLGPGQLDCGAQSDLWQPPNQVSTDRTSARLNQPARDLKFNDDVMVEAAYHSPYVQVRGEFNLQVDDVTNVRDGAEQGTKLVEAKAGVKIQHSCFQTPLPIMGVKKGNFRDDVLPIFLFRQYDDGWRVEKLVH